MTNPPDNIPVSAFMITFNNERTVERALQSVSWADEIVVVDSFSTDGTLKILGRYTQKIEQREWPGFRDQYQYASDLCSNQWVVFIDADEEVSPELAEEMQKELKENAPRPDNEKTFGYHAPRRTFFLGRWIMHGAWVPDHEIRLYHRDHGRWLGGLHARVHVEGKEAHLKNFYYHDTYEDISDQLRTINKYTSEGAGEMVNAGKRARLPGLLCNPVARFFRDYILKRGFLDGMPGLIIAVNTMFHVFVKYAKLWEAQRDSAGDKKRREENGP